MSAVYLGRNLSDTRSPGRQSSHTGGFLLVAALEGLYYTVGPMSDDQHKQIGIRRGATPFNMSTVFIKENVNFEKWQELKGRSEKVERW
jgi:hypothetical protein